VKRPELVIGLVGPIAADRSRVVRCVIGSLSEMGYHAAVIKVSGLFRTLPHRFWRELPDDGPADLRYVALMTAGDTLRQLMDSNDAAALLAIREIVASRPKAIKNVGNRGVAFIVDSLKTPEEVSRLRGLYGNRFFAIAVHGPRARRCKELASQIATSRHATQAGAWMAVAEELVYRDERGSDANYYGQNTAAAFPGADLVCESFSSDLDTTIDRFFRALFGDPYVTPTREELGMAYAYAASRRSAAMSRQVGAALMQSESGSLLSIGCNEVPAPGGGQYWPGPHDARDFVVGFDPSDSYKRTILANTIERLMDAGWKPPNWSKRSTSQSVARRRYVDQQVNELWQARSDSSATRLRHSLLVADIVDLNRTVHAEMAALIDCARRGVAVQGATLFSTTFPCHECARHLVAAGITDVYYLEPYAKSLVAEYFSDSIAIDAEPEETGSQDSNARIKVQFRSFSGVAPVLFHDLFRIEKRKQSSSGLRIDWNKEKAFPRRDIVPDPDRHAKSGKQEALAAALKEREEVKRFLTQFDQRLGELSGRILVRDAEEQVKEVFRQDAYTKGG